MRIKRKFVDLWKRILLITFCIVAMTGLTGCEKNNVQERATDTYVMKHKDAVDKRSMDTSGRLADAAEKSYYDSLDKLTKQGGGLDTSSWEGDDAIDKWYAGLCTGGPVFTGQRLLAVVRRWLGLQLRVIYPAEPYTDPQNFPAAVGRMKLEEVIRLLGDISEQAEIVGLSICRGMH